MTTSREVLICCLLSCYVKNVFTIGDSSLNKFLDFSLTPKERKQPCNCYMLGTIEDYAGLSECDANGYCECLQNVIGKKCDACRRGYYGILVGNGCRKCDCDPHGSEDVNCHQLNGQCVCKTGYTGTKCNMCDVSDETRLDSFENLNCTMQCDDLHFPEPLPEDNQICRCRSNANCEKCVSNYYFSNETFTCIPCHACYQHFNEKLKSAQKQLESLKNNITQLLINNDNVSETETYDFLKRLKTLNNNINTALNKLHTKPIIINITKLKHLATILDFLNNRIEDILLYLNGHINFHYLEKKLHKLNMTASVLEEELDKLVKEVPVGVQNLDNVAKDVRNEAKVLEVDSDKQLNKSTALFVDATRYYTFTNLTVAQIKEKIKEFKEFVDINKGKFSNTSKLLKLAREVSNGSKIIHEKAKTLKDEAEKLELPTDESRNEDMEDFLDKFKDLSEDITKAKKKFDLVNEIMKLLGEIDESNINILRKQEYMDELDAEVDENFEELQRKYIDFAKTVEQLKTDMDILDRNIKQLNENITAKQKAIKEQQNNLEKLQEIVKQESEKNDKLQEKIELLEKLLENYEKFKDERIQWKQDIADMNELLKRRKELKDLIVEAENTLQEFTIYTHNYKDLIDEINELIEYLKLIPIGKFKQIEELINEYDEYFYQKEVLMKEKDELQKQVDEYEKLHKYFNTTEFCLRKYDVES